MWNKRESIEFVDSSPQRKGSAFLENIGSSGEMGETGKQKKGKNWAPRDLSHNKNKGKTWALRLQQTFHGLSMIDVKLRIFILQHTSMKKKDVPKRKQTLWWITINLPFEEEPRPRSNLDIQTLQKPNLKLFWRKAGNSTVKDGHFEDFRCCHWNGHTTNSIDCLAHFC